ncbi:glycoside hydrolase family 3 N-terminal domain-containing protein [Dactylosporangium sp. CA-233914]|uniref:glycoside hydrolase family 3 N-terminal domain-containing protein n=1 Tax=Dactylosporangium sp. CA-233914 TaxID=3239934 RepID=UPI003D928D58
MQHSSPRERTPAARARELLDRMTLDEKVQQLVGCIPGAFIDRHGLVADRLEQHLGLGVGHVSNLGLFGHKPPHTIAKTVNGIQRFLVERTRLGIPAIFHNEALSGVVAPGHTLFPAPSALAATFSPDLVRDMARIIGRQLRSIGFTQALAPVMDIARDARWGRFHETYGEDVYLVTSMSVAYTLGLQGTDHAVGAKATAKHFLGYSMTEAGQNMAATAMGPRELYDVHATPFEAAIRMARLGGVMNSYSEIDGVPVGASHQVLTELLRNTLGFTGSVISDYHTIGYLHERHRVADSIGEAGVWAIHAGIDVELPVPLGYGSALAEQVRSGRVPEDLVDRSVLRVLSDKFELGLFEQPYVNEDPIQLASVARQGERLSRDLARRSVTLLQNEGQLLPLDPARVTSVAVIGPHADNVASGIPNYTYPAMVSMLKDILDDTSASIAGTESVDELFPTGAKEQHARELAPIYEVGIDEYLRDAYGAISLTDAVRRRLPSASVVSVRGTGVTPDEPCEPHDAIVAAEQADVVILALGGRAAASGEYITEGEGNDTADLDLPANQIALARAVAATGKPVVAVISMGRPYGLTQLAELAPAMLTSYYAGPEASQAAADVLFGDHNPAGRLPFTLPRASGQVPIYYSQKTGSGYRRTDSDMHHGYLDLDSTPLLPFGHGLSYTVFDYGALELDQQTVSTQGHIVASVTVTNVGSRAGDEVVQLYISDTAPFVTRPGLQLVAFRRISLTPGASERVRFRVPISGLGYTGIDGRFGIDPGPILVSVGASSADLRSQATVNVTGERRLLGRERTYLADGQLDYRG